MKKIEFVYRPYPLMLAASCFIFCLLSLAYAYSGGSGTQTEPYQIASVSDWQTLMGTTLDWNKHFIMINDVNLQGVAVTPVGSLANHFVGTFDGGGHRLRNAVMNNPTSDGVGLFYLGTGGQIRDLGVENVQIIGRNYVGSLAGTNYEGTITDCYSTGLVSGNDYVGGLVGESEYGTISECFASVAVSAGGRVGGLVGGNYPENIIRNCYAQGAVSTGEFAGGLVGENYHGTILNSYSTGRVSGGFFVGGLVGYKYGGTVTASFWDKQTSNRSASDGGTGKNTIEMKTLATFTSALWDFLGETANGSENIWRMCADGVNYPLFSRQYSRGGDFVCPDTVDFADYSSLAVWWLTDCNQADDCDGVDLNTDGAVDFIDLDAFACNWLE